MIVTKNFRPVLRWRVKFRDGSFLAKSWAPEDRAVASAWMLRLYGPTACRLVAMVSKASRPKPPSPPESPELVEARRQLGRATALVARLTKALAMIREGLPEDARSFADAVLTREGVVG